ncbi:MAG TPA: type II toxin-antitoxin system PemK/MazF family toxin [Peptococcaceae bacterium]|nr:type II toxin-antitoxin system PemK/MazF family toxin [Peptococcaceae bacterium]
MVEYQWGIFWADLEPTKGSEQAGVRPVLVVSSEIMNEALPIVSILALTSLKKGRKIYPIEVLLSSEATGLPQDSIAMAHQIRAISKERLKDKVGYLNSDELKEKVKTAIRTYLDL